MTPCFQQHPKIHVVSMWFRCFRAVMILHVIRPIFHLATALPGTPMHCQHAVVSSGQDPHLYPKGESFLSFLSLILDTRGGKSCGDLMYSGHMIICVMMVTATRHYSPLMFSSRVTFALVLIAFIISSGQGLLILLFRNHYTTDVLFTIILVVAYWMIDVHVFPEIEVEDKLPKLTPACDLGEV